MLQTIVTLSSPLCGSCLAGYREWRGSCVECDSTNGSLLFGIVVLSLVLVVSMVAGGGSSRGASSLFFSFVQTCVFELGSAAPLLQWLAFVNMAPHDAAGDRCIAPLSPYESLALGAIIPFVLLAESAAGR